MRKLFLIIFLLFTFKSAYSLAPQNLRSTNILSAEEFLLRSFAFQLEEYRKPLEVKLFHNYKNLPEFRYWLKNIYQHPGISISLQHIEKKWAAYTNKRLFFVAPEKNYRGKTINLSDPSFLQEKTKNKALSKFFKNYGIIKDDNGNIIPLTNYEKAVISLRSGDTVIFTDYDGSEKKVVLGDFIGAGNAAHVFSVHETDVDTYGVDTVIKIPMMIKRFAHTERSLIWGRKSISTIKKTNEAMQGHSQFPRVHFPFVKVIYTPPQNELAIIEKVEGFSMKKWVNNITARIAADPKKSDDIFAYFQKDDCYLFQKLIQFYNDFRDAFDIGDIHPAQIVYDVHSKNWTLVDWSVCAQFKKSINHPNYIHYSVSFVDILYQLINDPLYSQFYQAISFNLLHGHLSKPTNFSLNQCLEAA